ncbi:MAG: DUF2306 domain-containing protein [Bdellovibrionales bacterium]|nr:DUF2306 domain-containing protein [Bdellovibrionales bacterium]
MLKTLNRLSNLKRTDWIVISSLLLLSIIPVIAGIVRMNELIGGIVTAENSRFHASPIPVTMHIISVTIYSLFGAFQFSEGFRMQFTKLHRQFGKILIVSGFFAAITGLWMSLFYPAANYDGPFVQFVRLIVGTAMLIFLVFGVDAILRQEFKEHGAWMIRAYALGLGAGTQVLTHVPWFVFPSIKGEFSRAVFMTLGWVINVIVAEVIIQKTITIKQRKICETI